MADRLFHTALRVVRASWLDVLCVAVLLAASWFHLSSLERVVDLPPWDEADYLRIGSRYPDAKLPDPEWGPLYALWYFALSKVAAGPVQLFYLSYRLLIVLPTLLIYACVRRFRGAPIVAFCGGLAYLVAFAPHIVPRSSLLAATITLAAVAVSARARRFSTFAAALAVASLLASFARPETFVSFAIASLALFAAVALRARRTRGTWRRELPILAVWAIAVTGLFAVGGNPMSDRSNRRLYAFCQHYALGEVTRSKLPLDPWGQCTEVMSRSFGPAKSVGEAARRNPGAFAAHLFDNAWSYPRVSLSVFLREHGHLSPPDAPWTGIQYVHRAALAALALGAVLAAVRAVRSRRWRRLWVATSVRRAALVTAVVVLPTATSALLIWPREHYLVLQGVAVCLFAVAALAALQPRAPRGMQGALAVVTTLLALFVAARSPELPLAPLSPDALPNQQVVDAIRKAPWLARMQGADEGCAEQVGIFEAQGGYDAYLGSPFRRWSPSDLRPDEDFGAFIARAGIRIVVLEDALVSHHLLKNDPRFAAFLFAPEAFGFSVTRVEGSERRIAFAELPLSRRATPAARPVGAQP